MPANLWKSRTVRFMAFGHSLHEAECIAAVIVIDCLVMYTIMGYRFSDAEREWPPDLCFPPETRPLIRPGNCGMFPGRVNRDSSLLPCQPGPAQPAGCGEYDGIPGGWRISSAVPGTTALVCW